MKKCQKCYKKLENITTNYGRILICPSCFGHYYSEVSLSRFISINIWNSDKNISKKSESILNCGNCQSKMNLYVLPKKYNYLEIDVCNKCKLIWLDKDEIESLNLINIKPKVFKTSISDPEINYLMTIAKIDHDYKDMKHEEFLYSLYDANSGKFTGLLSKIMFTYRYNFPRELIKFIKNYF